MRPHRFFSVEQGNGSRLILRKLDAPARLSGHAERFRFYLDRIPREMADGSRETRSANARNEVRTVLSWFSV